jgi:hypothetical protein
MPLSPNPFVISLAGTTTEQAENGKQNALFLYSAQSGLAVKFPDASTGQICNGDG